MKLHFSKIQNKIFLCTKENQYLKQSIIEKHMMFSIGMIRSIRKITVWSIHTMSTCALIYEFFSFLDKVCKRPWNFERVPNAMIQGHDRALIFTSTKEACLAACLNEVRQYYVKWLAQPRLLRIKNNCIFFVNVFPNIFRKTLFAEAQSTIMSHYNADYLITIEEV